MFVSQRVMMKKQNDIMVVVKYILSYKVKYLLKNERKKIRTCDYLSVVGCYKQRRRKVHALFRVTSNHLKLFCMKLSNCNFFVNTNSFENFKFWPCLINILIHVSLDIILSLWSMTFLFLGTFLVSDTQLSSILSKCDAFGKDPRQWFRTLILWIFGWNPRQNRFCSQNQFRLRLIPDSSTLTQFSEFRAGIGPRPHSHASRCVLRLVHSI
jgi:hypothetical protein